MIGYALRSRAARHRISKSCLLRFHEHTLSSQLADKVRQARTITTSRTVQAALSKADRDAVQEKAISQASDSSLSATRAGRRRRQKSKKSEASDTAALTKGQNVQEAKTNDKKMNGREVDKPKDSSTKDEDKKVVNKEQSSRQRRPSAAIAPTRKAKKALSESKKTITPSKPKTKARELKELKGKDDEHQHKRVLDLESKTPASLRRLHQTLGIYERPSEDEPGDMKAFVPLGAPESLQNEMISKLRLAARKQGQIMTKNVLVELLRTNAFSSSGRQLILKKLKASLVTQQVPRVEDIVEAAAAAGSASEPRGISIKQAMQGRGSQQEKSEEEIVEDKHEQQKEVIPKTLEEIMGKPRFQDSEINSIDAQNLVLVPHEKPQPPVPCLAYGLDRALFNPGVYHLRDPRSRVFNFDPYLQTIMPVAQFDFSALKDYVTSSKDTTLVNTARELGRKYTGSTSSMTSALAHFHYLLSQWRDPNIDNLSKSFPAEPLSFSAVQRSPAAIFLRYNDGVYAIDADKQFDNPTVLSMLGKSMEKLLTLPTEQFERYHRDRSSQITADERDEKESFHYTTLGDFLMRSQLDAYDPRIPGTGMFDLKTRAVVSIRMDALNYENGKDYEIQGRHGEFHSYEREYFDMIRSAFLKYSLQVRMGRMDGIYVAFHNTQRIFGFQYISLPEMDKAIHGTEDTATGDAEFKLSLELLNRVLDRATAKYPKQSLRIHFETRKSESNPFMYIFATPVTNDEMDAIQNNNRKEFLQFEREVLGIYKDDAAFETEEAERHAKEHADAEWEALQAEVEEQIQDDELASVENDQLGVPGEPIVAPEEEVTDRELSKLLQEVDNEANVSIETLTHENITRTEGANDMSPGEDLSASLTSEENRILSDSPGNDNMPLLNASNHVIDSSTETAPDSSADELSFDKIADDSKTSTLSPTGSDSPSEEQNLESVSRVADESAEKRTKAPYQGSFDIAKDDPGYPTDDANLLAMYLTVRNKVDDELVLRPDKLTKEQNWTVEYALASIPTQSRGKILYNSTLKRRAQVLQSDPDVMSSQRKQYFDMMKVLVEQGKKFRIEENKLDALHGQYMYGEDKPRAFKWDATQEVTDETDGSSREKND